LLAEVAGAAVGALVDRSGPDRASCGGRRELVGVVGLAGAVGRLAVGRGAEPLPSSSPVQGLLAARAGRRGPHAACLAREWLLMGWLGTRRERTGATRVAGRNCCPGWDGRVDRWRGCALGQAVPVRRVDHPGATPHGPGVAGQQRAGRRPGRARPEAGAAPPVSLGANPDDLAVGAVGLRPPDRHLVVERRVELGRLVKVRPARTCSRTMRTCRSTRPLPVGR